MSRNRPSFLRSPWMLVVIILFIAVSYFINGESAFSGWPGAAVSPTSQVEVEPGQLALFCLDVGQGDCLVAESDGQVMVVDSGSGQAIMAVLNFLDARDVQTIDYLLLSHAHEDHIGNAAQLLRRYDVKILLLPMQGADSATYDEVLQTARREDVETRIVQPGDSWALGAAQAEVLGPLSVMEELNDSSTVLKLSLDETDFLLTGDMEAAAEAELLTAGADIEAEVLKVAHHGSSTSSGAEFLAAVDPELALISLAADNEFGFPHDKVLRELNGAAIAVYRTDQRGSIAVVSNGSDLSVTTDR